jgi:predicted transcriptional regulator
MMRSKKGDPLILEISRILGMGATSREILHLLARTKKKLSVHEICLKIHRSERAVRMELGKLSKSRLIKKEWHRTRHSRIACRYSMPSIQDLIKSTRKAVLKRLRGLKSYTR